MFLQILIVLITARLLGRLLRHLGQPPVIGEMAAGFVLGPMILGWFAPGLQLQLFGTGTLEQIKGLGQLGLVLFMFLMGAELHLGGDSDRRSMGASARIAAAAMLLPMGMGLAISPLIYSAMAPPGVGFWPFALFLGTALSVTALPIMARILKESELINTAPGKLALSAAALTDAVAWLVLAGVVAAAKSAANWGTLALALVSVTVLCLVMFAVVRPLISRLVKDRGLDIAALSVLIIGALVCAYITELLEVHAAFGAFLFGLTLPRSEHITTALVDRLEPVVLLVLMPCFFVLAGLSTSTKAFSTTGLFILALILFIAIAGKFVGGLAGARASGQSWRHSMMIGALMNTRGVTELVFLKVGLDTGLLSFELFTALFVTALVTTLMTSPLLSLMTRRSPQIVAQTPV